MTAFRPYRGIWLQDWLAAGRANRWIRRACDPLFTERSFHECATLDELRERFLHGNWSLGSAFVFRHLCFISQVDGGDEWLVLRRTVAFESASCARMIEAGTFDAFIADVQVATNEQLRRLEYRRTAL